MKVSCNHYKVTGMAEPKGYHRRQQYELRDHLPMWVVCTPATKDFAGQWVARMHLSLPAPETTDLIIVAETRLSGLCRWA